MSGDQVLAIDRMRSTLGTLSEEQREAAAASFFEQHALPVVEGRFCTFATRAAADGLYLRHRVNLWPDDLEHGAHPRNRRLVPDDRARVGGAGRVPVRDRPQRTTVAIQRPLQPATGPQPAGRLLGVLRTCGYAVPDWAIFRAETDPGQLVDLQVHSSAQGRDNRVAVYLPARFEPRRLTHCLSSMTAVTIWTTPR